MSREKQIEEMWNIITTDCDRECVGCEFENDEWCFTHSVVNKLYNAGYRKQEWISVDERLPEPKKLVLCIWELCDERTYGFARYQREDVWYVSNEGMPRVTHWMPLPEVPKVKGGAE